MKPEQGDTHEPQTPSHMQSPQARHGRRVWGGGVQGAVGGLVGGFVSGTLSAAALVGFFGPATDGAVITSLIVLPGWTLGGLVAGAVYGAIHGATRRTELAATARAALMAALRGVVLGAFAGAMLGGVIVALLIGLAQMVWVAPMGFMPAMPIGIAVGAAAGTLYLAVGKAIAVALDGA